MNDAAGPEPFLTDANIDACLAQVDATYLAMTPHERELLHRSTLEAIAEVTGPRETAPRLGGGRHPGEVLRWELADRNCTQAQFALLIGRPVQVLSEIFNAKKAITAETALQLEDALDIPAERWLHAQADYDLQRARERRDSDWPFPSCINPPPANS